jgi:hypothetical protein
MSCPGFQLLLDYLDGRLDRAAADVVSAHLALGCSQCDGDREWYQQVKRIASSDGSIEPPPWVLKRALRVFDTPRVRMSIAGRVGCVVASLVFDSLRQPAIAGARSSGVEGRQLLYRAEDYSIDVQVAPVDQRSAELTGQILREGESMFESVGGLRLDLIEEGRKTLSAVTNERGEFTIGGVDFGRYELRVDVNEASITIVDLPIGV